jgi:hypothetical protein
MLLWLPLVTLTCTLSFVKIRPSFFKLTFLQTDRHCYTYIHVIDVSHAIKGNIITLLKAVYIFAFTIILQLPYVHISYVGMREEYVTCVSAVSIGIIMLIQQGNGDRQHNTSAAITGTCTQHEGRRESSNNEALVS